MTACTPHGRPWRKASCRVAESPWPVRRLILAKLNAENDDQRVGIEIVRKAAQMPLRQIAENAGEDGAVDLRQGPRQGRVQLGLRCADRRVQGHGQGRHHRSHQGRAVRIAARRVGRFADDHHRGNGGGAAGEISCQQWIIQRHGLLSEATDWTDPSERNPMVDQDAPDLLLEAMTARLLRREAAAGPGVISYGP